MICSRRGKRESFAAAAEINVCRTTPEVHARINVRIMVKVVAAITCPPLMADIYFTAPIFERGHLWRRSLCLVEGRGTMMPRLSGRTKQPTAAGADGDLECAIAAWAPHSTPMR